MDYNFVDVDLKSTAEDNLLAYATSVILTRAIPDSRDMLKYSARQLLYSQLVSKADWSHPIKKAQKSVAAAMERYYIHGEASAYGTLIRMGKPFAYRYPLQEVRGSFGTVVNPNDHSASRYVEMRMSSIGKYLFDGIEKNTISDWRDNYDQTDKFPMVLPSIGFYNIVNGATGIGVGLSTSIPQFNLREVNAALVKLIENPNSDFSEIYCPIDFATGGIIINEDEVKESLRIGYGKSARVRSRIDYDADTHQLIVKEIPYGVYTNTICDELAKLLTEQPTCGIEKFIDASEGYACIKITLTKSANPFSVVNLLYKETSLQSYFSINMMMLDDSGSPKYFGWREALLSYISHIKEIKRKEAAFDRQKLIDRDHILNGFLIALANISDVVETIKTSSSIGEASSRLISKFNFSAIQAKAILDLKLQRLVGLEYAKIESELKENEAAVAELNKILEFESELNKVLIEKLEAVSREYGDDRRTENLNLLITDDNLPIERKELIAYLTNYNNIYIDEVSTLLPRSRGAVGNQIKLLTGEFIKTSVKEANYNNLLAFSNKGKVYNVKLNDLEVGSRTQIFTLLSLEDGETITNLVSNNPQVKQENKYVIIITKGGIIKKSFISEYEFNRAKGITGVKLKDGDEVCNVVLGNDNDVILMGSKFGYVMMFALDEVKVSSRDTVGIKGLTLREGDSVVSGCVVDKDVVEICSATKNGIVKRTPIKEFSLVQRANKGTQLQKLEEEDELVNLITLTDEAKEIAIISTSSVLRLKLSDIPITSRNAIGASAIKLKQNQQLQEVIEW